jgi:hypothetical protein
LILKKISVARKIFAAAIKFFAQESELHDEKN